MAGRSITIEFLGKDKSLGSTATAVESKFGKLGGKLDKVGMAAGKILAGGFLLAGGAAVKFGRDLANIERINAQTASVIEATGGAANVTGADVETLAGSLEKLTATEGEAIQEGANLLLTFKNIKNEAGAGNDIFNQTTAAMTDMARAMGTDPKTAAMQLGKALNDPIKGLSALGRVGIQFTADQKSVITSLQESGDTMGAQKIILKELESQFGGSGEAFAKTAEGKMALLGHRFGEIGEEITARLMPAFDKLLQVGMKVLNWTDQHRTATGALVVGFASVLVALKAMSFYMQHAAAMAKIWTAVTKVAAAVQWVFNAAMAGNPIVLVVLAIAALTAGLVIAYKKSETFRKIVDAAFRAVGKAVGATVDFIKKVWAKVTGFLSKPVSLAIKAIQVYWKLLQVGVKVLIAVVKAVWSKVTGFLSKPIGLAIKAIQVYWSLLKAGVRVLIDVVKGIWARMRDILAGPFEFLRDVAGRVWDGLKTGVRAARDVVVGAFNRMRAIIQGVVDWVQKLIDKIQSIPGIPGGGGGAKSAGTAPVSKRSLAGVIAADAGRAMSGVGARSSGNTYIVNNVNGALDGVAVARQIETILIRNARLSGRPSPIPGL